MKVHGAKPTWYHDGNENLASFSSDPDASTYDEPNGTGFPRQIDFDDAVGERHYHGHLTFNSWSGSVRASKT
jgi:hypothetical protein